MSNKTFYKPPITKQDMKDVNEVRCYLYNHGKYYINSDKLDCKFLNIRDIPIETCKNFAIGADRWIFVKKGQPVVIVFDTNDELINYLNEFLKDADEKKNGDMLFGSVRLFKNSDLYSEVNDLNSTHKFFRITNDLNGHSHRAPVKKIVRKPVCKNKVNKMVGNVKKYENSVRNMF